MIFGRLLSNNYAHRPSLYYFRVDAHTDQKNKIYMGRAYIFVFIILKCLSQLIVCDNYEVEFSL